MNKIFYIDTKKKNLVWIGNKEINKKKFTRKKAMSSKLLQENGVTDSRLIRTCRDMRNIVKALVRCSIRAFNLVFR